MYNICYGLFGFFRLAFDLLGTSETCVGPRLAAAEVRRRDRLGLTKQVAGTRWFTCVNRSDAWGRQGKMDTPYLFINFD